MQVNSVGAETSAKICNYDESLEKLNAQKREPKMQ